MRAAGRFLILFVLAVALVACSGSSDKPKDRTAPVITLTGANPLVIEAGTAYVELGATALDNRDGDLTNAIVIDASQVNTTVPGSYAVTYNVSDAAGNAASTVSRTVVCEDTTPPVIVLLGDDPQVIVAGNPYIELGATASDTLDGDLTAAIAIDATAVNTMVAGDYPVTYDVTDAAGNAAVTVMRTVRVELPPPPPAPQVSVGGDIKQLNFSWDDVANADYYRLMENPDGHSGFTQVGDEIPMGTLTATRDIAVHLHDWVNALYIVQACTLGGCTDSAQVSANDQVLETIGYFKASNTDLGDWFGRKVSLSADGKLMAIGAPGEGSAAMLINGDQDDDSIPGAGAVYIFENVSGYWVMQAYVKPSNPDKSDRFGSAIALSASGNRLAVGAPFEDSGSKGINGDQADDSARDSGAVYLYGFDGLLWSQQAYIKPSNTDSGDWFGWSLTLAADGNLLIVGAPSEDSASTGVNGDQYDNSAYNAGAAYIFRFDGFEWTQEAYLKASNAEGGGVYHPEVGIEGGDAFGASVSVSAAGNVLAAGAPGETGLSTGVNGDEHNDSDFVLYASGAAYVFEYDGANWSQEIYAKPTINSQGQIFGDDLALSANGLVLAIGAPGGIIEDRSGDVFVFRSNPNGWVSDAHLKASNYDAQYPGYDQLFRFGSAIALNATGDLLAVGAPLENNAAQGIGGDEYDVLARDSGAVYVFAHEGSAWNQEKYVKSVAVDESDHFGTSISLSSDGAAMAVGAHGEDSSAFGIGGDSSDNSAEDSGALYVY